QTGFAWDKFYAHRVWETVERSTGAAAARKAVAEAAGDVGMGNHSRHVRGGTLPHVHALYVPPGGGATGCAGDGAIGLRYSASAIFWTSVPQGQFGRIDAGTGGLHRVAQRCALDEQMGEAARC